MKLVINILEKGRTGVAIGTQVKVKGTDYWKEKTATGWKHVKVPRKAAQVPIINNKNNSNNTTTPANDGTQVPAKRGRGRPRKDPNAPVVQKVQASAPVAGRGRGRPRKNPIAVQPTVATTVPEATFDYKDGNGNIISIKLSDIKDFTKVSVDKPKVDKPKVDKPKVDKPKVDKPKVELKKVVPDNHPIGHRLIKMTKTGKFYWSEKQADGSWAYVGDASEAQIKAYKIMLSRQKKADKLKADTQKNIDALKQKQVGVVVPVSDLWNNDGTPTAKNLASMGKKEQLYWTDVTARARKICDMSGILCLDTTTENYVEDKLNTVFKLSNEVKVEIEKIQSDVPLDSDAKFVDDPAFMHDTLEKLEEYKKYILDNKDFVMDGIRDHLRDEMEFNPSGLAGFSGYATSINNNLIYSEQRRLLGEKTETNYLELMESVDGWITDIKNNDNDRLHLEKLREMDESLSGLRMVDKLPQAIIDTSFRNMIDEYFETDFFNKYNTAIPLTLDSELYKLLRYTLGIPRETIESISTNRENINTVLMMMLNPNIDKENAKYFFEDKHDPLGMGTTKTAVFNYDSKGNSIPYGTPISAETFFKNSETARNKYKDISDALGILTSRMPDIVVPPSYSYRINDMNISANSHTGYKSGLEMADDSVTWKEIIPKLKKVIKSSGRKDIHDGAINHIERVVTATSQLPDSTFRGVIADSHKLLKDEYSRLTDSTKSVVKIPDNYERLVGNTDWSEPVAYRVPDLSHNQYSDDLATKKKKGIKTGKMGLARKSYSTLEENRSILRYEKWKRDAYNGGVLDQNNGTFQETYGDTAALKAAIRTKWAKRTTLQMRHVPANFDNPSNYGGADNHSSASLAVAIGLNWQLRKLTKKDKIIPEWKWAEGTKPFDSKNTISSYTIPKIITPLAPTTRSRYRRGSTGRNPVAPEGAIGYFSEEAYKKLLLETKQKSIAAELGLLDMKPVMKGDHPSAPKIALKNSDEGLDYWNSVMRRAWTHDRTDLSRGRGFSHATYKITSAFDIMYPDYQADYDKQVKIRGNEFGKNGKDLFMGTDFIAGSNIMKAGAQVGWKVKAGNVLAEQSEKLTSHGHEYNTGNYTTTSFSKTLGYMNESGYGHGTGVVFRISAAMGRVSPAGNYRHYNELKNPDGSYMYDTIYGHGITGGNTQNTAHLDHDEHYIRPPKEFGKVQAEVHRVNPVIMPLQWLEVTH